MEPTPMLFICFANSGHDCAKYDMYSEDEFHRTINRYNDECGGVRWAKLFNKTTGEVILSYPQNSIRFIMGDS